MLDSNLFKSAMRRFGAAVAVVTTQLDGERRGLTATAVCSASAEPPRLLVCVNRSASAHGLIVSSSAFAINLLSRQQEALAQVFGDSRAEALRFRSGDWQKLVTGAPILRGSVASFDCRIFKKFDLDTHTIFVGDVVSVLLEGGSTPLGYLDRQYFSFPRPRREWPDGSFETSGLEEIEAFP